MQNNKLPHFEYHLTNPFHMHFGCIMLDGMVVHKINNFDEFYKKFGYTPDMRKAGVVPEEFIWTEYIKNTSADFAACIQIHIIEYLIKYSDKFRQNYGEQCESWLADHAKETIARGIACAACRAEQSQEE